MISIKRKGDSVLVQWDTPEGKGKLVYGDGVEWFEGVVNPRGAGDAVANTTKAAGVKPCGGCKKRQSKLNRLFPWGK